MWRIKMSMERVFSHTIWYSYRWEWELPHIVSWESDIWDRHVLCLPLHMVWYHPLLWFKVKFRVISCILARFLRYLFFKVIKLRSSKVLFMEYFGLIISGIISSSSCTFFFQRKSRKSVVFTRAGRCNQYFWVAKCHQWGRLLAYYLVSWACSPLKSS